MERGGKATSMKRILQAGCLALMALVFAVGCTSVAPDQGQEAVVISKPWFFGHGGVYDEPVKTGRSYYAPSADAIYVNMQPQLFLIHFDDFMSRDGVPLDFDVALRLQITNSVKMAKDFGVEEVKLHVGRVELPYPKWYVNNVHKNLENAVRQAVRKHGMNETAISTVAIEEIDKEITAALEEYLKKIELPAKLVDFTVGRANPPDAIKNQRIETATQEQRKTTEDMRRKAEDQRKDAEIARAAADNAFRNAMQLSPEQYLRLEQIKMQAHVCVNPNARCVFGGVTPVVEVGKH